MSLTSKIQWTDATWNIARGCTKVDTDCKFCYMYRDSFDGTRYTPNQIVKTKTVFDLPLKLKEPSKIFTCSLTDFFHEGCDSFRGEAWEIIRKCPQHTFQILTKRPERIIEQLPEYWEGISSRVWLGTSVGSNAGIQRIRDLVAPIQPGIKFLSLEPLHGEIILPFDEKVDDGHHVGDLIDWVIVGGESGNETGKYRYRPCKLEWIESIVAQCKEWGIAVFVKQMGTHLSKELKMSDRHGGVIEDFPAHLQIRQFPKLTPETKEI
jgi:protein gp37